jgi:hypothetical protein
MPFEAASGFLPRAGLSTTVCQCRWFFTGFAVNVAVMVYLMIDGVVRWMHSRVSLYAKL